MPPAWIVDSGLLGLSWGSIPDLTSDWELRNSDFWLIQEHSISELITSLNSRQTSYSEDKERETGLFIQGPRHRWRGLHGWKQSGQLQSGKQNEHEAWRKQCFEVKRERSKRQILNMETRRLTLNIKTEMGNTWEQMAKHRKMSWMM